MNAAAKEIQNVQPAGNPERLLELAVQQNLDVDKLERLMELHERWQAKQARMAFFDALGQFQEALPPIKKTKEVPDKAGNVKYRYAPLDEIIKTLKKPLRDHGFSYRWATEHLEDGIRVTCFLTHESGHEESSSITIPRFPGIKTNAAQDEGSATTYGRRYSFANVAGITIDEDDDGQSSGPYSVDFLVQHNNVAREWLQSILAIKDALTAEDKDAAAEVIAEMPRPVWTTLWRAPKTGGLWTTNERKILKEDEALKESVHTRRKDSGWYDEPENQL